MTRIENSSSATIPRRRKLNNSNNVSQTHDIFLRAYAVPSGDKQGRSHKPRSLVSSDSKWPEYVIAFDTETRITADQSLTFGVYRICRLVDELYCVTEEGIFFADDLPAKDVTMLQTYVQKAVSDVPSFPPRFPLYSRSDFTKKVFWPVIKGKGAMVCGLNLPFDLARIASGWSKGDKGEWSLILSQYEDGGENRNCPRILITPIDSKKAFIRLAKPWKPDEWKDAGDAHFLDVRTLGWALFNKSFSLKRACKELNTEHQKLDDYEPTGEVSPEEIEYARQDVRCTVDVLNALKQEFDRHPIDLKPWHAYSPASIAKSYLDKMGIARPATKFAVPKEMLGISMQGYYGGRSETRIRHTEVPVVPVDFTSEYPTCCANLGLFDLLTAESLTFEDDTRNIRRFLKHITIDDCFDPGTWAQCKFFALVKPDDDILPVRTVTWTE